MRHQPARPVEPERRRPRRCDAAPPTPSTIAEDDERRRQREQQEEPEQRRREPEPGVAQLVERRSAHHSPHGRQGAVLAQAHDVGAARREADRLAERLHPPREVDVVDDLAADRLRARPRARAPPPRTSTQPPGGSRHAGLSGSLTRRIGYSRLKKKTNAGMSSRSGRAASQASHPAVEGEAEPPRFRRRAGVAIRARGGCPRPSAAGSRGGDSARTATVQPCCERPDLAEPNRRKGFPSTTVNLPSSCASERAAVAVPSSERSSTTTTVPDARVVLREERRQRFRQLPPRCGRARRLRPVATRPDHEVAARPRPPDAGPRRGPGREHGEPVARAAARR